MLCDHCSHYSVKYDTTDYSHSSLPAGSSDDVSRVHSWRRHICCVEEGAVVGMVLIVNPFSGIFD